MMVVKDEHVDGIEVMTMVVMGAIGRVVSGLVGVVVMMVQFNSKFLVWSSFHIISCLKLNLQNPKEYQHEYVIKKTYYKKQKKYCKVKALAYIINHMFLKQSSILNH